MLVAALAMFYAAGVEWWRLSVFRRSHGFDPRGGGGGGLAPGGSPERVPVNIMWQSPAFVLVGLSEVLASVGQLEFFYDQVRGLGAAGRG
jgi:solute carrier family 15 (peptide/histidine transporter), member 3/4